jgi:pSer/pThr/pTyr-binding forkhead associated (FHA) protein
MECPRCGLMNTEAARFCPGCGNALGGASNGSLTERPPFVDSTLASNDRNDVMLEVARPEPPRPTAIPRPPNVPRPVGVAVPEVFELVVRPELPRVNGAESLARGHRPAVGAVPIAHLAVISQDGSTGQTHWIDHGSVDIGREEGDIRLAADRFVSPRHARVQCRGSTFFLRDLDSLNGVYLRVRESEALIDGDSVLLGSEVLRFALLSGAEQGLGPAVERGTDVYGSPARPRYACLCERTVEGVHRNVFYISSDETVIGREFGDLVFTADSFMSRRHAAIHRDPSAGTFSVRDLGSSNGTYLAIRGEVELREGDHLRVGQHLFRFGFGS